MNIIAAVDSFKGSLTSMEAGNAIREGIRRVYPQAKVKVCPLADGGEGTVDALVDGMQGEMRRVTVTGPLGQPVECGYGMVYNTGTAVIEMSGAAGITLVPKEKRNPLYTTTFGVGEVIRDAMEKGCRRFLIGIGGSATNDGGAGMLQALGFGLLDFKGDPIPFGARGLKDLVRIVDTDISSEVKKCRFRVACDVTNPLCGEQGASAVYGPQKGADPEMIRRMDAWLGNFAALAAKSYPKADPNQPGAGAAGGLGFALRTFLDAELQSGVQIILEETGLEEHIRKADLVITGEGRMDGQTAMGKAPVGVAGLAKKYGKPVIALSGCVTRDAGICNRHGIDAFFPILREVTSLQEAMEPETAGRNLADAAEQVMRLWKCAGNRK